LSRNDASPKEHLDAVALHLVADDIHFSADDVPGAIEQIIHGDLVLTA